MAKYLYWDMNGRSGFDEAESVPRPRAGFGPFPAALMEGFVSSSVVSVTPRGLKPACLSLLVHTQLIGYTLWLRPLSPFLVHRRVPLNFEPHDILKKMSLFILYV